MTIKLRDAYFNPWDEILQEQNTTSALTAKFGATASFVGTMRDFNQNHTVSSMTLEHYPGMTEKQLQKISDEATSRWPFLHSLIIHRVGTILPNEPIVLVAIWSTHRGAAFDACRYIMEALKNRAPFWKKESINGGSESRWVKHNTDGY